MSNNDKPTNTINLLLQLGKIGTRVQILKENGDLYPDQLFFKSLSDRKLTWSNNRKSIVMSPYVLILPGKITGLLSCSPTVERYPDSLCLGIVSKDHVLELIFQNSRDRSIWSEGLELLISGNQGHTQFIKPPSPSSSSQYYLDQDIMINTDTNSSWNGNDIIQWHEITGDEKKKIETLYPFLVNSYRGCVFQQYHSETLRLPTKVLVKLDMFGDRLQCINIHNEIVFEIPFDSDVQIIDRSQNDIKIKGVTDGDEEKQNDRGSNNNHHRYFKGASSSMHCFSIIRNDECVHIGCHDLQQYELWRYGLQYLSMKRYYNIRMRVRRAILAGDLVLSPSKQLIESPLRSTKPNKSSHHQKEDSLSKSSSFWGSLFG